MKTSKMRENCVKTISLQEGLRYDLSCTPRAFQIHVKLFNVTLLMGNEVHVKTFWYGLYEIAWFP